MPHRSVFVAAWITASLSALGAIGCVIAESAPPIDDPAANGGAAVYNAPLAVDASATDAGPDASNGAYDAADAGNEDAIVADAGPLALPIVVGGAAQSPFALRIGAPSNWGGVDVGASGSTPDSEIVVSTVDGTTPGSARRIAWTQTGQVYAQSAITNNLSAYASNDAALVMRVRVDSAPIGTTTLRANCQYPCGGEVDVSATLASIDDGNWHTLAVPVSCLTAGGLDLTTVDTPWLLFTTDALTLSIENVRWAEHAAGTSCTDFVVP